MMKKLLKVIKWIFYIVVIIMGFFALLYLYTSGPWKVADTVAQDSTISHITIDEVVFHAESFGNDTSRTLIILHGGPGQDYKYLLPLKKFSDEFKVVFYDQRGTGLSPRVDPSELTLKSSIADLDRIIDYYAPGEKVNILGHSWGAMLASGYLTRHPEKVNKIILAEPGFLTTEMSELFNERTNGFKVDMTWSNIVLIGKIVLRGLHLKGPDDQAIKDYIYGNLVTANVDNHPMAGYFCNNEYDSTQIDFWRLSMEAARSIPNSQMDEHGNMQIDLVTGVEHYPDTVLFITGECNSFIGPDYQEMHLKYFPRHKMEVIENAGHNMFLDQPEAFFKVVRAFLREDS
jgi:proline iminopeptidase